jgi:hypothetical protein
MIWTVSAAAIAAVPPALAPIPEPPQDRLPIDEQAPNYPCDQVLDKLVTYNQMARQHDQSISSFLGEVTQKLGDWYAQLSPLEGSTQDLPAGTFAPIQDGSDQIAKITDLAFDNSELLANEMDRIIVSLRECMNQPPQKK